MKIIIIIIIIISGAPREARSAVRARSPIGKEMW